MSARKFVEKKVDKIFEEGYRLTNKWVRLGKNKADGITQWTFYNVLTGVKIEFSLGRIPGKVSKVLPNNQLFDALFRKTNPGIPQGKEK